MARQQLDKFGKKAIYADWKKVKGEGEKVFTFHPSPSPKTD
jgi:hypothetical protein